MKILFVASGRFQENASLIRAAALGGELLRQGHDPIFCLTDAADSRALLEEQGVAERCCWVPTRNPLDFAREASRFSGVEFIHLINANFAGEVLGMRLRGGGTRVISDWDEWLSRVPCTAGIRWKRLGMEFLARRISSAFVFSSSYLQALYRPFLGGRPTTYIPYGLNPFTPVANDTAARWLRPGRRYALYLGSLQEAYREDLRELALLSQSCRDLDLDLVVVGDGPERVWLERDLTHLLLGGRAVFTGRLSNPDLDGLVADPAVCLGFLPLKDTLPNRCRCPNKLLHYVRGGKPVVTNRVGEPASLLGSQGHYYTYADPVSLTAAVRSALEHPPRYVLNDFSWSHRTNVYVRFLEENFGPARSLVSQAQPPPPR